MLDSPWLKSYPKGIRWDADLTPMPVDQILDDAVAKWPLLPAVSFMGRTLITVNLPPWSTAPRPDCRGLA